MQREAKKRRRPSLSLPILRTSRNQHRAGTLTLGNLLSELGETSFGWAIVVFSLLTLLPLPPGFTLITALPLLMTTGQMIMGYPHVWLPAPLARLQLDPVKLRRTVLRLRPVTRRLERILTPRYTGLFARHNERPLGVLLFVISFALFLPVPLSGWFPAVSMFIVGVGLVERDGLVSALGLIFGGASVLLTTTIVILVFTGADALIN
ncbi:MULTISPECIES: exopolysaccharide biosynthesis protein [Roseobacteraceae]|uniref:Exopolysaccharide synthesis, ExoD n=1 Tax=Pseudosulfitobacter pseudonitzschiae TaxID=1402135 RepID=A0A221K6U7_9RHOB|nr:MULTISPECIES: exopolysaccharide biosynthesis protein [Roseobacteraceae]ASM74721.1 exopolysaccharide synthesis, ExoD [Pseudosulfitobacter pseudonitzschiae]